SRLVATAKGSYNSPGRCRRPRPQRGGMAVSDRPRILVLEGAGRVADLLQGGLRVCDAVRVGNVSAALALLREQRFDAFCADPADLALREQAGDLSRAGRLQKASKRCSR